MDDAVFWICGGVFFAIAKVLSLFVDATDTVDALTSDAPHADRDEKSSPATDFPERRTQNTKPTPRPCCIRCIDVGAPISMRSFVVNSASAAVRSPQTASRQSPTLNRMR